MIDYSAPPEHTFLTPAQVFARYRWGRSKGYEMLRSPGFPPRIGDAYRLDTLVAWEQGQLAGAAGAAVPPGSTQASAPVAAASGGDTGSPTEETTSRATDPAPRRAAGQSASAGGPPAVRGRQRTRGLRTTPNSAA